jgi:hypothetical protein
VVACGVRKVWKKEFTNLDTPSGQIKRLNEILKDLGMSGRPSLEKARSLRAQRELAQELSAYLERFASKIQLIATSCIRRRTRIRRSVPPTGDEKRKGNVGR